jgi:hypothetical protein
MEKVIRDGKVAVLYSPGYGAGWYSWHDIPELIYDPVVVEMVENLTPSIDIVIYCKDRYPEGYYSGAEDLTIYWIEEGEEFIIEEYDGSESIRFKSQISWLTA